MRLYGCRPKFMAVSDNDAAHSWQARLSERALTSTPRRRASHEPGSPGTLWRDAAKPFAICTMRPKKVVAAPPRLFAARSSIFGPKVQDLRLAQIEVALEAPSSFVF